ncbi:MAG: alpha/beta hydrolase [Pseudomonadota bacterium]
MGIAFEQRFFTTRDGATIGYQVAGPDDAPKILLCNGLGGNHHAYQPLVNHLGDRFRFLVWDYRGLFTSAPPRGTWPPSLSAERLQVEQHAADGLELLALEGYTGRFPIIAWSMGVQVALELYRRIGARVTGMALLNGISGRIYDTVFGGLPGARQWVTPLLRVLRVIHPVAQKVVETATGWSHALDLATTLGIVHRNIDREAAGRVLQAFGELDQQLYFVQLEVLGTHDAADVLPTIQCPCMVTASDRDVFTPGFATRAMASDIPDCEVFTFETASHYAPIEFADEINGHVARFLDDRVFSAASAP